MVRFFYLFLLQGNAAKTILLFSEYLTNSRFCTILNSHLENVTST